jgi:hypothetical protein
MNSLRVMAADEILPCLCNCDKGLLVDYLYCDTSDIRKARERLGKMLYSIAFHLGFLNQNPLYASRFYVRMFARNFFDCAETTGMLLIHKYDLALSCPDMLFHGTTSKNLPSIMKKGLDPSEAGQVWKDIIDTMLDWVYLTDSLYAAECFSIVAATRLGGDPVILKVNVRDLKGSLNVDYEQFDDKPKRVAFDVYKEFWSEHTLSPRRIRGHYKIPTPYNLSYCMHSLKKHFQEEISEEQETAISYFNRRHEELHQFLATFQQQRIDS